MTSVISLEFGPEALFGLHCRVVERGRWGGRQARVTVS